MTQAGGSYTPCGRIMVGSGGDTYDPLCDLHTGHPGPCKSTAAIDQHKLTFYPPGHPREPRKERRQRERSERQAAEDVA